jgi:outer membrane murein-binding lipoprotein Lpp
MRMLTAALLGLSLSGCIAQTALDVATLPVKVAKTAVNATSAAVDVATESQAEADQKLGRKIRKQEECMGRERKRAERSGRDPDFDRCDIRED